MDISNLNLESSLREVISGYINEAEIDPDIFKMLLVDVPPQIFVLGPSKGGKTSILYVLFNNTLATDTLYLDSTSSVQECNMQTGIKIYDFPGQDENTGDYVKPNQSNYFNSRTSIIFVIDSQDDVQQAINYLIEIMNQAYEISQEIKIRVFIHKVDGLSDDLKYDIKRDIEQKMLNYMEAENLNTSLVSYFLTSIYDNSINEAMSVVAQELIPQKLVLETMLNSLATRTALDKVYLFDTTTKTFIATDYLPNEHTLFEFCCETITIVEDIVLMWGESQNDDSSFTYNEQRGLIALKGDFYLYFYQVNSWLTLMCIVRNGNIDKCNSLEYNAGKIAEGIRKVLKLKLDISPMVEALNNGISIEDIVREQVLQRPTGGYNPPMDPTLPY